jgi:DNA invertase Pin-like site-specific DNA recombinase
MLLGYARVSKGDEQSNKVQAKTLRAAGCRRIFAGFRSITEAIDTTTPAGRMMMQMVGAFAEFERAMIRERTSAGLAAARAEGRVGGRRKKLDPAKRREIAESVTSGRKTGAEMARLYNVSAPTVSRIVAAHRAGLA